MQKRKERNSVKMVGNKLNHILFTIFNYKENDNAEWLYRQIAPVFPCRIIDCDSGVRPDSFNEDTVYLPNVYYGGMLHKAVEMAREGNYDYLFLICSDVRISEYNLTQLLHILQKENFKKVGVYSPSHSKEQSSYTTALWGYCQHTQKKRKVPFVEGMISMYKKEVYEYLYPCKENARGWWFDLLACYYSNRIGLQNIVDDRLIVYHPQGNPNVADIACQQATKYINSYPCGADVLLWREMYWKYSANSEMWDAIMSKDYKQAIKRTLRIQKIKRLPIRLMNFIKRKTNRLCN